MSGTEIGQSLRGRLITLEGGEAVGKSTQALHLRERLEAHRKAVLLTREPGGTAFGEQVRAMFLSGDLAEGGSNAEAVLVSAGRLDHVVRKIRPALNAGTWVICDRFHDSTAVYQGILGGGDTHFIEQLAQSVIGDCEPDLTLVFDLPVEKTLARLSAREVRDGDRFDDGSSAHHETVRQGFLQRAAAMHHRTIVVDADGPEDHIAESVWTCLCRHFRLDGDGEGLDPNGP